MFRAKNASKSDPREEPQRSGVIARLKDRLSRTRSGLLGGLAELVSGRTIDDEILEELETRLLLADVGVDTTAQIMRRITARASRRELRDLEALLAALRDEMLMVLEPVDQPLQIQGTKRPFVILAVGVNGVGKTTTIGKLAERLRAEGRTVLLAAGDTFRAAAIEQLQAWGERTGVPVVAQETGADAASVIFDAIQAARARAIDVVIADTAGRLHTQGHLMAELEKIKRVIGKQDPGAPHETLLVVDAGTGQNALSQAATFHDAIGISGIVLTKLDGTAKGGIVLAIARRLGVPVRFVGTGEGVEDLRPFVAGDFASALLGSD